MATPQQLMEVLARVTCVPLSTVIDHDRKLTTAGLRSKSGRGFSVAKVTARDAANLLTSLLAASRATDSVQAVERYAATTIDRARSSEALFAATNLVDIGALPARHGFVEALAAVLTSAATGALAQLGRGNVFPQIEVLALTCAVRARIRIAGLPGGKTASVEYKSAGAGRNAGFLGDLEQSRRITARTIISVAEILGEGGQNV